MMNIQLPSSNKEASLSTTTTTKRKGTATITTTKAIKLKWLQVLIVTMMIMMTKTSSSSSLLVKAFTTTTTTTTTTTASRLNSFTSSTRNNAFVSTKIKDIISNNKKRSYSTSLFLWNNKVQSVFFNSSLLPKLNNGRYSSTFLFMETSTDKEDNTAISKITYNIPELKKEIARLSLRCHKKIGKATTRLSKANEEVEEIRTNPDVTQEQLEACPNIGVLEQELDDLRKRLRSLNDLEEKIQGVKNGKNVELPDNILSLVIDLGVNDAPPTREERPKAKKEKGPRTVAPRLPYFRYYSENNTEIRVSVVLNDF